MRVELTFREVPREIQLAMADICVEDQSEMDAPSVQIAAERIGPFTVTESRPTVLLEAELPIPEPGSELSLIVRVRGVTSDGQRVEYLNTSSVSLPHAPQGFVEVEVFRIS